MLGLAVHGRTDPWCGGERDWREVQGRETAGQASGAGAGHASSASRRRHLAGPSSSRTRRLVVGSTRAASQLVSRGSPVHRAKRRLWTREASKVRSTRRTSRVENSWRAKTRTARQRGIAEEKPAGPSTNVCEEQADEDSNEERRRGGQTPPDGGERGHRMCVREGERGESGELAGGRGLGGWRTRTEGRAAEGEQGTAGGTRREEQRQMKVEEEASAGLACLAWLHPARPRASSKWEPDPGGCCGSS